MLRSGRERPMHTWAAVAAAAAPPHPPQGTVVAVPVTSTAAAQAGTGYVYGHDGEVDGDDDDRDRVEDDDGATNGRAQTNKTIIGGRSACSRSPPFAGPFSPDGSPHRRRLAAAVAHRASLYLLRPPNATAHYIFNRRAISFEHRVHPRPRLNIAVEFIHTHTHKHVQTEFSQRELNVI
ncbi:hypothetical protein QTP88_013445 [Uroleucon formosanum]